MKKGLQEWPLVVFTLASQTAVGMFAWLAFLSAVGDRLLLSDRTAASLAATFVAAAILGSLAHLGSPRHAVHTLRNLRKSWLSREIAIAAAFALATAVFAVCAWLNGPGWYGSSAREGLVWLAAIMGIGLVWAEYNVYRLRTAPGWTNPLTIPDFLLTGWLLGGISLAIAIILEATRQYITVVNPWFPLLPGLLAGLALESLVVLAHIFMSVRSRLAGSRFAMIATGRLLCLAGALFALIFWQITTATGLILLAELSGRIGFYNSRSRVGV